MTEAHVPAQDPDWRIRLAAFAELGILVARHGPVLPWRVIEAGFTLNGRSYLFANVPKGIFRPAGMSGGALSIKTVVPKRGHKIRYNDLATDDAFSYSFQDRGINYHDNQLLLWCARVGAPFVYFFGIAAAHFRPIWPVYVQSVSESDGQVLVAAGSLGALPIEPGTFAGDKYGLAIERRYSTVEVKRRLHQDAFRHLVLTAYSERCAICNLRRRPLLEAAHIVPDRDPRGEPSVRNGLSLCKLHHGAFDADLIGIRPDRVIEVARELLEEIDGPTLEVALKGVNGRLLQLPRRTDQHPDKSFLEERYESFRKTA